MILGKSMFISFFHSVAGRSSTLVDGDWARVVDSNSDPEKSALRIVCIGIPSGIGSRKSLCFVIHFSLFGDLGSDYSLSSLLRRGTAGH